MISRRILVISRSPALSRAIQASLGPGYQVVTSTNVIDVEDEVREQGPFDVLVAGPVFDSHAGMARLAGLRSTAAVPAVVLALGPKPKANLSDIVRTGAVELVEYPTSKRQLSAALKRAFDIAGRLAGGCRADNARGCPRRRRRALPVRRGVHRGVVERRLWQDVLRHEPGLLPGRADRAARLPGRPGPAVRRGLDRARICGRGSRSRTFCPGSRSTRTTSTSTSRSTSKTTSSGSRCSPRRSARPTPT